MKSLYTKLRRFYWHIRYKAGGSAMDLPVEQAPWIPQGKPNPMHVWDDDEIYCELYEMAKDYTYISRARLFTLYQIAFNAMHLGGSMAEAGVYKGGSALLVAELLKRCQIDKAFYLFDTWMGHPAEKVDERKDWNRAGQACADFDECASLFSDYLNCSLHRGIFPDETSSIVENVDFSYVHVDTDLFNCVWDCCCFFYPRMVNGGYLFFDDYGFWAQIGAKNAIDEFFREKKETPIYFSQGGCLIIKQ